MRDKIWRCYRPGQEVEGDPSDEYLEAAKEVQGQEKGSGPMPLRFFRDFGPSLFDSP